MLANLTLMYSKNIKINLIENKKLSEIDDITANYIDEEDLKKSSDFKEQVDTFYRRYSTYCNKIKNPEDKKGCLIITFNDENGNMQTIKPIYNSDKDKLDIIYLTNKIERKLKEKKDKELILKIYKEESFLKTEYNYRANNIGYCIQLIDIYGVSATTNKQYNKLVKVIKDTILMGYNKETKETKPMPYFHARKIDDIINKVWFMKPANIIVRQENISSLKNGYKTNRTATPTKKEKENYHGAGDYYLDYFTDREEKRWTKK